MKTDKLRKFLIPNIPYVFIGWAFLKLSTAYRLAAGAGFLTKVMGIGQTTAGRPLLYAGEMLDGSLLPLLPGCRSAQ